MPVLPGNHWPRMFLYALPCVCVLSLPCLPPDLLLLALRPYLIYPLTVFAQRSDTARNLMGTAYASDKPLDSKGIKTALGQRAMRAVQVQTSPPSSSHAGLSSLPSNVCGPVLLMAMCAMC